MGAILLCLALQAHLVFVQEVNWDEFFYLSYVHHYQRGTLASALQTFHVLLFAWVPLVAENEITQVEAARIAMLVLEAGTAALIYGTARAFLRRQAALVAALAYLSSGYVLLHGASFRADPIAAFLLMTCLWLLARSRLQLPQLLAMAVCGALAMLVTVKSIFYLPAFAGVAYWRISREDAPAALLLRLAGATAAAAALFVLLYFVHLSVLPQANLERSVRGMSSAYKKTFLWSDLFPRTDTLAGGTLAAPVQSLLLATGIVLAAAGLPPGKQPKPRSVALLLLAAPLASFVFYRNAFPYFVGFIFPPAAVLAGLAADRLSRLRLAMLALPLVMAASAGLLYGQMLDRERTAQEETVALVHRLFPDPVPYIDRSSMIASFPKQGFFMSTWGIEDYRGRGTPIFRQILEAESPRFVLANSPTLADALQAGGKARPERRLFPEDAALLRANYIHHWGALWVAGKSLTAGPQTQTFEILIPGTYTLEGAAGAKINGRDRAPGEVMMLSKGRHIVEAAEPVPVVLRWGNRLPRPSASPSDRPIFWGF